MRITPITQVDMREDLYQLFPKNGIGAEIGVARGLNAVHLLHHTQPKELHLVDKWNPPPNGYANGEPPRWSPWLTADLEYDVRRRFADNPNVHVHRAASLEWLQDLAKTDKKLDWIYIDARHKYEYVSKDIRWALSTVRKGGVIAGHDFCWSMDWGMGPIKAVLEQVQAGRMVVEAITIDRWPSFMARVL